ncbi:ester cyclase [Nocardia vaccinii]|uniref:ester cyclase n=1 Tax=Nocardia vaccinii TaxID=1822 RepID=UPI000829EBC1|nr:ester cyclase [Nocardia vaccinii]
MTVSVDTNKEIIRRYIEIGWGQGDLNVIRQTVAFEMQRDVDGAISDGGRDVENVVKRFRGSFPDARTEVVECVAEDEMVVVRVLTTGTHRGEYLGVPATGRHVEFYAFDMFRLDNGRIVESCHAVDEAGLLRQLTS